MKIIDGNLISLALAGEFDVIAHGCNCFCKQRSGIAKQMSEVFSTDNSLTYPREAPEQRGNYNKMGIIEYAKKGDLTVVNCYTQYNYGRNYADGDKKPLDYIALRLCMRKLNRIFAGKKIGLPWIGCGLAGGDKNVVQAILEQELPDVDLTIVNYKQI